ncbi:MAG: redoxin domain-containing protein [Rhodospirillales bacterium]|nr:redoxin domain-containing protein [Rhodospirillales bacterium]MCB9964893.1 redoxin domain-containing protein [Rhodospirillales bacterium]
MLKQTLFAAALLFMPIAAQASVEIGAPAPDFTTTDVYGHEIKLSDYHGKNVVLEWSNNECPYVMKHYDSKNMQTAQKTATDNGAIWLTIVSSAEGKQGSVSNEEAQKIMEEVGSHATTRIMDPSGEIGQLYGAKTTPHMFVIDAAGNLAYSGAIDDNPSPRPETVEGAKNYVLAALDSLTAGTPVEPAQTAPYGCSVKY